MSCNLDIKDIANEMKKGTIDPRFGLSASQMAGVLTAVVVTVDQDVDAISAKGLGAYGLSALNLQSTGVVKCGVDPTQAIADILADPSVFTGRYGVNSSDDLLNEALQQQLMTNVITSTMNDLAAQGAITCGETDMAELAGQASEFSSTDIIANIAGNVSDLLGSAMDALGALAVAGALIGAVKDADILGKLSGFGSEIASMPDLSIGTIDTSALDAGFDSIVGSARIASAADPTTSAASNASSFLTAALPGLVLAATALTAGDTRTEIPSTEYIAQC